MPEPFRFGMMMRYASPLVAWLGRLRKRGRTRDLRRSYLAHLREEPRTLEERVRYHLEHVDMYWSRCLGFVAVLRPISAAFLASDGVLMILAASDEASDDIQAFCAERGDAALLDRWRRYEASLRGVRLGLPDPESMLRTGSRTFAGVLAQHGSVTSRLLSEGIQPLE